VNISVTLTMTSYIGHPYWPERDLCIDIEKKSGVNRQKSEDKRRAALEAECKSRGMTYDDYLAAKEKAAEPWYRNGSRKIIIPRHQMAGALVQAIGSVPAKVRGKFTKDNFRALVQIGDFETDREESDGTFSRFVKLDASNQRSHQTNDYIGVYLDQGTPVTAVGQITIVDEKSIDTVHGLFEKAITDIGVGAARKMGFGRGLIAEWKMNGK
jgi:hypothetical protein